MGPYRQPEPEPEDVQLKYKDLIEELYDKA
jgi:hypothetical protein